MDKYKSRKLWFFSILAMVFTIMQAKGFLPEDAVAYSNLMIGIMIGFAGGNVGEHFAKRAK